jgi:signal peptidase I
MTDRKTIVKEYLGALAVAVLAAILLRIFVVQAFRIPTGSMKDTLLVGDFLLVNKFVYGVRTPDHLPGTKTVFPHFRLPRFKQPQRGDVVVFKYPQDTSLDYIKRCVGLPGDTVRLHDGRLTINGKAEGAEMLLSKKFDEEESATFAYYHIAAPDGKDYTIRRRVNAHSDNREFGPVVVPEGHYFMMGDNRDNSADSRSWGFLPEDLIVGEALLIYFSYDKYSKTLFWNVAGHIRWNRLLRRIR